jgi:hypothetical protein
MFLRFCLRFRIQKYAPAMIASTKIGVMAAAAYMPPRLTPSRRPQSSSRSCSFGIAVFDGDEVVCVLRAEDEAVVPELSTRFAGGVDIVVQVAETSIGHHDVKWLPNLDLNSSRSDDEGMFDGPGPKGSWSPPAVVEEDMVCGFPLRKPGGGGRSMSGEGWGFKN